MIQDVLVSCRKKSAWKSSALWHRSLESGSSQAFQDLEFLLEVFLPALFVLVIAGSRLGWYLV